MREEQKSKGFVDRNGKNASVEFFVMSQAEKLESAA
jgi:hypothetical protein